MRDGVRRFTNVVALAGALVSVNGPPAAAQEVVWVRQFGTPLFEDVRAVEVDGEGNVYVAGHVNGTLPGQTAAGWFDAYVRKYDADGNELWTRQFGSPFQEETWAMAVDATGAVYLAGTTDGALPGFSWAGLQDGWIRKYDAEGNHQWTEQFGSLYHDGILGVAVGGDGTVVAVGLIGYGSLSGEPALGGGDAFVIKYDPGTGERLWTRQFGTDQNEQAFGAAVDALGHVYVTGFTQGTFPGQTLAGGADAFVRKYDADGTVLWTRQYGTTEIDFGGDVQVDGSGNIVIAGDTLGSFAPGGGDRDGYLRKYDASGNVLWTREVGTSAWDSLGRIAVDAAGDVSVGGVTGGTLPGQTSYGAGDAFAARYDATGSVVWIHQFGTAGGDRAADVDFGPAGHVYVGGYVFGALAGQTYAGVGDAYLLALDPSNAPPPPPPPPPSVETTGKVTGGGSVMVSGGVASFGFTVQRRTLAGPVTGELEYVTPAGVRVHGGAFSSLSISGNTATFAGSCTSQGTPCTFTVTVVDGGPGSGDSFSIALSGGPPENAALQSGNVRIQG